MEVNIRAYVATERGRLTEQRMYKISYSQWKKGVHHVCLIRNTITRHKQWHRQYIRQCWGIVCVHTTPCCRDTSACHYQWTERPTWTRCQCAPTCSAERWMRLQHKHHTSLPFDHISANWVSVGVRPWILIIIIYIFVPILLLARSMGHGNMSHPMFGVGNTIISIFKYTHRLNDELIQNEIH